MTAALVVAADPDEWVKDPADVITFRFGWRHRLPAGVTIVSATCTIDPTAAEGVVVDDTDVVSPDVYPTLSGGVLGANPPVICTVTLSNGGVLRTEKTIRVRTRRS